MSLLLLDPSQHLEGSTALYLEGWALYMEGWVHSMVTHDMEGSSTPQRFSRRARYRKDEVARQQWYHQAAPHLG